MLSFSSIILVVLLFDLLSAKYQEEKNNFQSLNSNEDKLIFAHVIYRHGDRNIDQRCPNDPWKDEIHWPEGYGQLTQEGKRQHFKLGQYLSRRYGKLIGKEYSPKKLYIISSEFDRTMMSAQANLAGMFPPTGNQIWNENLLWQPIPVHVAPFYDDYILHMARNCPKLNFLLETHTKGSPEIQQIYSQNKEKFLYWSQQCGTKMKTMNDVRKLHKTLYIESVHNKTLQTWAQKAIERNGSMEYIAAYDLKLDSDTPQLARLSTGFLLKDMLNRFSQKINKTLQPNRSLWIYSAHETTIAKVLNSLGVFELHIPPYASSLHFELYKEVNKTYYIQIFYRKSEEEYLLPMNIPNCGKKCTLDQLYHLYGEIIPGDIASECRLI